MIATLKQMIPILSSIGLLVLGLAILIKGADWLVEGASNLARRIGMSELAIGLTIVAFGTSLPELTVNIFSSFSGANDLAIGNIIGSNVSNILLILGITAIFKPLAVQKSTVWKELPFSFLAALALVFMANDRLIDGYAISEISRTDGFLLLSFFLIFLWYTFGIQKVESNTTEEAHQPLFKSIGLMVVGIIMLVLGGRLGVNSAVTLGELAGLSQALIGITIVAIGTSLPELATSIVAARKNKADLAIGNIVGSNIFNIFWILGISSSIRPLTFTPDLNADISMVMVATLLLFYAVHNGHIGKRFKFWSQRDGHVLERSEGIVMTIAYVIYTVFLIWRG